MRLTTKSEYGILCLLYLARNQNHGETNEPVSLAKISSQEGIQKDYVEKLMLALQRAEVVKAVRGLKGGFVLAKAPQEIRIFDVITALEGKTFEAFCDSNAREKNPCLHAACDCDLRVLWDRLKVAVDQVLNGVTLKDLLDGKLGNHRCA
ncbi:MAG TPA: Rrf2 family transcriptional regulator [Candidatus Omnitrophota bacterium]|nr:Rrf2 family transcriptional regulator [Candidatus Omnitrophota bacterium]